MTTRAVAILFVVVLAIGAVVQAMAHGPYDGWINPVTGASCCDDRDCQPVRSYRGDDGLHYVFLSGRWKPVPPERVLKIPSPDGNSHACVNVLTEEIYCFVAGQPQG